ncbi:hypothetical protein COX97_00110 [Candidatus Pacearchaeota archaeon CG_4_10_14_0_2_um_filter_05_32_18]|nr:MAG: hypothetical protein COX97_00110 [Candidatus Pacearchaeota archaeon CG_4_10_14_0_2_um_filter_05_32_18]
MKQTAKQTSIREKQKGVTKDMIIQDILSEHPNKAMLISEILMDFGIHCVGCGASGFETLEEGVLGHGFSEEELDILIEDLNKAVELKGSSKKNDLKINLTQSALKKIKDIMKHEKRENEILRVSVLAGGCSGYTYDLEIVPEALSSDIKKEQAGLKISIDSESAEYLDGAKIDFVDSLKESGFKFINPNATKECGCGKSFS